MSGDQQDIGLYIDQGNNARMDSSHTLEHLLFTDYQQFQLKYFKNEEIFEKFLREFQESKMNYMLMEQRSLCQEIQFILKYWPVKRPQFPKMKALMEQFIDIAYAKIFRIEFMRPIYKKLWRLILRLEELFAYRGDITKAGLLQNDYTNQLFIHTINQLKTRNSHRPLYFVLDGNQENNKKLLMDLIAENQVMQGSYQWESLYQRKLPLIKSYNQYLRKELVPPKNQIDLSNVMKASFFYQKDNISSPSLNECPIGLIQSVEKLQDEQIQKKIKEQAIGAMNRGGGIIVFDCIQEYFQVRPFGAVLNEPQKFKIRKQVIRILSAIQPKIHVGIDFEIQFIPLALSSQQKPSPTFIQDTYVTAINFFKEPRLKIYQQNSRSYIKNKTIVSPEQIYFFSQQQGYFQQRLAQTQRASHQHVMSQQKILAQTKGELWNAKVSHPHYFFVAHAQKNINKIQEVQVDKISQSLFYPLSIENIFYPQYVARVIPLTEQYRGLLKNSLSLQKFCSSSIQRNKCQFSQLPGSNALYNRYRALAFRNKNYIADLFKMHLMKNKAGGDLLLALEYFDVVIIKSYQQFQLLRGLFFEDQTHLSNSSFGQMMRHYKQRMVWLSEECNILQKYHQIMNDLWGDSYFIFKHVFQASKNHEEPPKKRKNSNLQMPLFHSVMISKPQLIKQIDLSFKRNKLHCEIIPLRHKKFRKAAFIFMVSHKATHPELQRVLLEKIEQFTFQNKKIVLLPLTSYIFLPKRNSINPLRQEEMKQLRLWLKTQYPNETLKLWSFEAPRGALEHYLSTDSQLSTIFMYIVLEHSGEKVAFKNPETVQNRGQRNPKMTLLYPIQQ